MIPNDPVQPSAALSVVPRLAAQVTEDGRRAARADQAARETDLSAPRSRNPFPHNSDSPTRAALAAAWAAGYDEIDPPPEYDEPPPDGTIPPYRYPPPR